GTAGSPSCAPYLCNGGQANCPNSCAADGDCAKGSYCAGGACVGANPNGTACNAGNQCSASNCVDGFCCNTPCTGACDRCDLTAGTCLAATARSPGSPVCGSYVCDGTSPACPMSCNDASVCATGRFCDAGNQCVQKAQNGTACGSSAECASGWCVDGSCRNTARSGSCDECASPPGTCSTVTAGP